MSGLLLASDHDLLLRLLRTTTISPLEADGSEPATQLWQAQAAYAEAARAIGFRTARHDCARPADVLRDDVPAAVRAAAGTPGFLAAQPSLVLRLGRALPFGATVMFNVHLDTVGGLEPVTFDGSRFTGRGAIDAKGPAVALLAGVRQALQLSPAVGREIGVVVQVVAGEEGGALGAIGTRRLIDAGFHGRLNIFCQPTGLRYLTRATAEMTARVRVTEREGRSEAAVLLGLLAQHFAATFGRRLRVANLRADNRRGCGTGELLVTLPYKSAAEGADLAASLERVYRAGLADFTTTFGGTASESTELTWPKRDLPCLDGGDRWAEALLTTHAGLTPCAPEEPAYPNDAIWMDGVPGAFTAVLGPGSRLVNHAHTPGEHADLPDLEAFAAAVSRILLAFARLRALAANARP
ncbi:M20/M25/M40 family metallo-hydrolase [Amycolatopsis sp. YIM 10]|uniref:M20/M25/M40 family metallo-hydrolase n=1 Tax=Amycolatopsis sp. YIM 10 TaxID=2653857 RepID=UPI00128FF7F8|nr:M20/M25/M40 family metallo-hydrolase [Amycolatopsis sp. YIM 10]QFU92413.1 succinyl-diaminopimelate desuccinylase [Amycolatopsis sp. YIM 10]